MGEQTGPAALGTQIGDARRARGMTQQQLADAVGVDRKTVNRWENGRTHGLGANYAKLAQALGWPPDQALRMVQGDPVAMAEGGQEAAFVVSAPTSAGKSELIAHVNRLLVEGVLEADALRRFVDSVPAYPRGSLSRSTPIRRTDDVDIAATFAGDQLPPPSRPAYVLGESEAENTVITDQARRLSWLQTSGILPPVAVDKLTAAVEAVMAMMIPGGEPIPDVSAPDVEKVRDPVR